jgi:hypothetical protein
VEVEGPILIPGPDGTQFADELGVPQGWGQVPRRESMACWCANPAGTYANESTGCVAQPCPYPQRCVDRYAFATQNGTSCVTGSQGLACAICSKRCVRARLLHRARQLTRLSQVLQIS